RRAIRDVVTAEAPVHEDRVLKAVREAWGVGRAGHRIRSAFDEVVRELVLRGEIVRDDDGFLWNASDTEFYVRVPDPDDPDTLRPIREVAFAELAGAVLGLTDDAHAITRADLAVHVARLFGWGRTGSDISTALEDVIDALIDDGELVAVNGHLERSDKG